MNPIFEALQSGHSPKKILEFLKKLDPALAGPISLAIQAGHPIKKILSFLTDGGKKISSRLPESPQNIYTKARTSVHPAVPAMAKTALAATGLAAAGRYALSRALPSRAIIGELFPAEEEGALALPYNRQELPAPGQAGFEQQAPIPEGPIPMGFQRKPFAEQNQPQIEPEIPISGEKTVQKPEIAPELPKIDSANLLSRLGVKGNVDTMLQKRNDIATIAAAVNFSLGKEGKKILKEAKIPLENIIEDYASKAPEIKPQERQNIQPEVKEMVPHEQREEVPKEPEKKLAVLPNGNLGEIESVKNGIAKINIDGEIKHRKLDDLTQEPKDLESAVRHIITSIPEDKKSTALQSAIHIPIPGLNLMITQFYDGKVAWYRDVEPELYEKIALGTYQPKTSGKTGIGEYKPSVIDSRGAGFSSEISRNPKYSKDQKGKMWGYASNMYDAFNHIQNIIHKISKEIPGVKEFKEVKTSEKKKETIEKLKQETKTIGKKEKGEEKPETWKKEDFRSKEDLEDYLYSLKLTDKKVLLGKKPKHLKTHPETIKNLENLLKEFEEKNQESKPKSEIKKTIQNKPSKKLSKQEESQLFGKNKEVNKKVEKKIEKVAVKRPDITKKGLKEQKEYILSALQKALKDPPDTEKIKIDVPGDGEWNIYNNKNALNHFKELIEKRWPKQAEGPIYKTLKFKKNYFL